MFFGGIIAPFPSQKCARYRFFPEIEGEVFMKNEAFMDEVKVGFGVMVLGFLRDLFTRIIRGLTILQNKLTDAVEKRLLTGAVA